MTQGKDRIRVQIEGKVFSVVGGTFQEMLAAVKQINGRRFVSELKVWQLPGTVEDIQRQLDVSGYYLEGGVPVTAAPSTGQAHSTRPGDDRIRVLVGGYRWAVVGGSFQEMLAAVKGLPGRRFDTEAKIWEIPGDPGVIKGMVEAAGFQLEGGANLPVTPVTPMEPPDFQTGNELPSPPPFEHPDFGPVEDEYPYEPPDWFDDTLPFEDSNFGEEAPMFEKELPPTRPPSSEPSFRAGPTAGGDSADRGDLIRISWGDMALAVTGGSFQEMLAVVKSIPGRRFDPAEKVWQIPDDVTMDSIQQVVKAAGFMVVSEES